MQLRPVRVDEFVKAWKEYGNSVRFPADFFDVETAMGYARYGGGVSIVCKYSANPVRETLYVIRKSRLVVNAREKPSSHCLYFYTVRHLSVRANDMYCSTREKKCARLFTRGVSVP